MRAREDFEEKTILKAVINGEIVGSVRGDENKVLCYVQRLMVHPDHQNKGIAKNLMLQLEKSLVAALCKRDNHFLHKKRAVQEQPLYFNRYHYRYHRDLFQTSALYLKLHRYRNRSHICHL